MKNIALVISSGGARGLAAIGIIEELENMGYNITSVSGSSIGALIGGVYATGNMEKFKKWCCQLNKKDIFKLMDFTISSQGLIKGEKVFTELKKIIKDVKIENLPIPYSANAVDLLTNKECVFKSGNLFDAIRASCSIPSLVQPKKIKQRILVDGGIINPLPFSNIKRIDNDMLIGINLNNFSNCDLRKTRNLFKNDSTFVKMFLKHFTVFLNKKHNIGNYIDISYRTFQIMQDTIIKNSIETYKPDLMISIPRDICGILEFDKSKLLIDLGRKACVDSFI